MSRYSSASTTSKSNAGMRGIASGGVRASLVTGSEVRAGSHRITDRRGEFTRKRSWLSSLTSLVLNLVNDFRILGGLQHRHVNRVAK